MRDNVLRAGPEFSLRLRQVATNVVAAYSTADRPTVSTCEYILPMLPRTASSASFTQPQPRGVRPPPLEAHLEVPSAPVDSLHHRSGWPKFAIRTAPLPANGQKSTKFVLISFLICLNENQQKSRLLEVERLTLS
jgi:hypothetical protein